MDSLTQELVKNERQMSKNSTGPIFIQNVIDTEQDLKTVMEQMDYQRKQLSEIFKGADVGPVKIQTTFSDRVTREMKDKEEDGINNLRELLRSDPQMRAALHNADPFMLHLKVAHPAGDNLPRVGVTANLDTGSSENWCSYDVVVRHSLEDHVVPWQSDDRMYVGFGGQLFEPLGSVELSFSNRSPKSWTATFLVHDGAPFEMVLGKGFLIKEGIAILEEDPVMNPEPVLANATIRLNKMTPEEQRQMEENARRRGNDSDELLRTRKAKDADARRLKREVKAASKASRGTTPGFSTPQSLLHEQPFPQRFSTLSGTMTPTSQTPQTSSNISTTEPLVEGTDETVADDGNLTSVRAG